jgi:hypothetical protein
MNIPLLSLKTYRLFISFFKRKQFNEPILYSVLNKSFTHEFIETDKTQIQ